MLVPTMMHRIWNLPEEVRNKYDLSHLRIMLHLAAPCPAWLKEKWIEWLGAARVHELYGGTEAQGATWISGEEWLAQDRRSVVWGKRVSVRVALGGRRIIKKKKTKTHSKQNRTS